MAQRAAGADRYVDMGVVLRVVRKRSEEPGDTLPGCPELDIVREHRFGGMVDTLAEPPCFVGPSRAPVIWYCSEPQERLILHDDEMPLRVLVDGAEGAGKTQVLAMWAILRALTMTGLIVTGGMTAPSAPRVKLVKEALLEKCPPSWATWHERDHELRLRNGVTLQLLGTKRHSAELGEKTQGFNWAFCGSDEIQDTTQEAEDGIEMRGRRAPRGRYRRMCTASVKDSPTWRTRRDARLKTGLWERHRLSGPENPFTYAQFWAEKRLVMSERAYQRRVLAMDVGPELAVYHAWSREHSLRPVPQMGARDITATLLRDVTAVEARMLIGHDPGEIYDVSIGLKAYELRGEPDPVWWAVMECTTRRTTTEEHGLELLRTLRSDDWDLCSPARDARLRPVPGRLQDPQVHVRCEPYGEGSTTPHKSVVARLQSYGLDARAANYANGRPARIHLEGAVEMINTLLCDASGRRRLFVACDDMGRPACPKLVHALETMERDEAGRAFHERKNDADPSHWPAALQFALWRFERARFGERRSA